MIKALIITPFLILTLCIVASWADDSFSFLGSTPVWMSFNLFLKSYMVCPEKWDLYDGYAYYFPNYIIRFHFISWIRYRSWRHMRKRRSSRAQAVKTKYNLLCSIQGDIQRELDYSQKQINRALKMTKDAIKEGDGLKPL